jgi:hypothetical protein
VTPATSCKQIKQVWSAAPSGTYWLDPDGANGPGGKYQVSCDMTTDGGGWMVIDNLWASKLLTLKNLYPGGMCEMTTTYWKTWDGFAGATLDTHFCIGEASYNFPSYQEMRVAAVQLTGYTSGAGNTFDAYLECYGTQWQGAFCFGPEDELKPVNTANIQLNNNQKSPNYSYKVTLSKAHTNFSIRSREEGPQNEGVIWDTGSFLIR